jgi:dCMP deaminase
MKSKWKKAFMRCAFAFSECSSAERLKVGCIIVKDNKIISVGYNGTPNGWNNKCEIEEKTDDGEIILKTKPNVIHAESNCLIKLAKTTGNANKALMFITHSPCYECAKMIYQSGIKKVYYANDYRNMDGVDFLKSCNVKIKKTLAGTAPIIVLDKLSFGK